MGNQYIYLATPNFAAARIGLEPREYLNKEKIFDQIQSDPHIGIFKDLRIRKPTGCLIIVESGDSKAQLDHLLEHTDIEHIEVQRSNSSVNDSAKKVQSLLASGRNVVVTCSENSVRTDYEPVMSRSFNEMIIRRKKAVEIEVLTDLSNQISVEASFLMLQGALVSKYIPLYALQMLSTVVLGRLEPYAPVWVAPMDSKFPGLPVIIAPIQPTSYSEHDNVSTLTRLANTMGLHMRGSNAPDGLISDTSQSVDSFDTVKIKTLADCLQFMSFPMSISMTSIGKASSI
jgi:hypothetical protein